MLLFIGGIAVGFFLSQKACGSQDRIVSTTDTVYQTIVTHDTINIDVVKWKVQTQSIVKKEIDTVYYPLVVNEGNDTLYVLSPDTSKTVCDSISYIESTAYSNDSLSSVKQELAVQGKLLFNRLTFTSSVTNRTVTNNTETYPWYLGLQLSRASSATISKRLRNKMILGVGAQWDIQDGFFPLINAQIPLGK